MKSLDSLLTNWYKETGVPSVCLTLVIDKTGKMHVKPTGHSEFQAFTDNPTVQSEFLKIAEKLYLKDVQQDIQGASNAINNTDFDQTVVNTMLSQNVLHFDIDSKRKLLTAAVLGNGIKRRKLWDINRKPEWWPADVPFRSPNAQPKCSVMELDKVLEKCNAHFVERFGPGPLEVCQHGMGVDREVDEEADRAIEQHSEQYGENAIDPEVGNDQNACEELTDLDLMRIEIDRDIYKEYTWNTAESELFLEGIGDVTSPALLKELLKVLPDHCPYPFTSSVGRKDIEFWYRHLVPTDIRRHGFEPVNVKGDGNCIFRAASMHIYGTERNWSWVKLRTLNFGLLSMDTIVEQINAVDMDKRNLAFHLTTDDVASKYQSISDDARFLRLCVMEEIMRTVEYYRDGTILHMMMISGAFGIRIHSFSSNVLLNRQFGSESLEDVCRLLWVPSSLNGPINHVVPLVHMEPEERAEGCCSIQLDHANVCSFSLGETTSSEILVCQHCLRDYHVRCVMATASDDNWSCFCHLKADSLSCLQHLKLTDEMKKLLHRYSPDIKKFITDMAKKEFYSPRLALFFKRSENLLRRSSERICLVSDASWDKVVEHAFRNTNPISRFRGLSVPQRISLNTCVIAPEVLAFLVHKTASVPMECSRRIVNNDNLDAENDK
ncbi:uncharacterized protein LOC135689496 [Rhopilema esculentum]|uniref:uncharacterized protein LOC135689496 n=1 Tax=Rhopilema esculentum TaxID=499914 RepID=UPI0031D1645E